MFNPRTCLSYDDVLLVPQESHVLHRENISLSCGIGGYGFEFPLISSPMDTITEVEMAFSIREFGGLGIIHRYCDIDEQMAMVCELDSREPGIIAAAVGANGDYLDRAKELSSVVNIICIDVAHGHHIYVYEAIEKILKSCPNVEIIAGNVATNAGAKELCERGVSAIRVGIGSGSICSTRLETGHGVPVLQSIIDAREICEDYKVAIIADGGAKNSGDIVKALAAGASFVMTGSLLSGTKQCPGKTVVINGQKFKEYRGMSSKKSQESWRGFVSSKEGVDALVPYRGDVVDVLNELERGIRSGISYSGGNNIEELRERALFIRQTSSGAMESDTHIHYRGKILG